jgi:hypothetical protein
VEPASTDDWADPGGATAVGDTVWA